MPKMGAFAVSISIFMSSATWVISACACESRVMSCPTPTTPTIVAVGVHTRRRVEQHLDALAALGEEREDEVIRRLAGQRASCSTSSTEERCASVMYVLARCCPITSSLEKPVISTALRFHSLTRPPASMPKMGALAVSISSVRSLATRCSSALPAFSSVMSWPTPTTPTVLPSHVRRVVALSSTSTRWPSLVKERELKVGGLLAAERVLQHLLAPTPGTRT